MGFFEKRRNNSNDAKKRLKKTPTYAGALKR